MVLRLTEQAQKIVHIPKPLYFGVPRAIGRILCRCKAVCHSSSEKKRLVITWIGWA